MCDFFFFFSQDMLADEVVKDEDVKVAKGVMDLLETFRTKVVEEERERPRRDRRQHSRSRSGSRNRDRDRNYQKDDRRRDRRSRSRSGDRHDRDRDRRRRSGSGDRKYDSKKKSRFQEIPSEPEVGMVSFFICFMFFVSSGFATSTKTNSTLIPL